MDDFRVDEDDPRTTLVTQMLWGHTTHIGCGWTQIDVGDDKFAGIYPGRYENFFVCNYGVGGNVPGEPVYQHPDCNTELGMHFCIHHITHEVFAGNKVEDLPVIKQKDEQIFSNFSVETRTIIGSCLEAIQCIEEKENFQCRDLSEICHSKGPQPAPAKTPVTRQDLECRIENILCHIDNTYPTLKCQEKYENCKKSTPQSRETPSASKTHGNKFLLLDLKPNCGIPMLKRHNWHHFYSAQLRAEPVGCHSLCLQISNQITEAVGTIVLAT